MQEGLNPSSELAKFFPALVHHNSVPSSSVSASHIYHDQLALNTHDITPPLHPHAHIARQSSQILGYADAPQSMQYPPNLPNTSPHMEVKPKTSKKDK